LNERQRGEFDSANISVSHEGGEKNGAVNVQRMEGITSRPFKKIEILRKKRFAAKKEGSPNNHGAKVDQQRVADKSGVC